MIEFNAGVHKRLRAIRIEYIIFKSFLVACSPFFGPPDKGDCLGHPHMSLRTSHCSVMSSPPVAGCAELFGRRVIE